MNKVILSDLAGSVPVGVTPSADLAEHVAIGVASPADLAGDATVGVASPAIAGVASSTDLAGVASSADLAEVASSAVAELASSADLAGVASLADLAGFVLTALWYRMMVIVFMMMLLGWRPWPRVREGYRLVWCPQLIWIVLFLLICLMRDNIRSVMSHREVLDYC